MLVLLPHTTMMQRRGYGILFPRGGRMPIAFIDKGFHAHRPNRIEEVVSVDHRGGGNLAGICQGGEIAASLKGRVAISGEAGF